MDTSKEYIKMCKEAYEIQAKKVPIWGFCHFDNFDLFTIENDAEIVAIYRYTIEYGMVQPKVTGVVWLPFQDQLQTMINEFEKSEVYAMVYNLQTFIGKSIWGKTSVRFDTFEKYWLAYLMEKVHKKKWDENTEKWQLIS